MARLRAILSTVKEALFDPAVLAVVVVASIVGSAAGYPVGQAGFEYTWVDSRFCDDCHIHDYANEAWARSVHAGLTTCHDCHRVPIRHYPKNLYLTVFDRPQGPEEMHAPEVENVICEQCHLRDREDHEPLTGPMPEDVQKRVVKIDHSRLHTLHLQSETRTPGPAHTGDTKEEEGEEANEDHRVSHGTAKSDDEPIICMDCHGGETNRAHRFESTSANCVECHDNQDLTEGRLEPLQCRECHFGEFLGD